MSIGLPRAGLNFQYLEFWNKLFLSAGIPFSISEQTNEKILKNALRTGSEMCMPMKLYIGHCMWLSRKVDKVFIPRYTKQGKYLFCALMIGMNDMIKSLGIETIPLDVEILDNSLPKFDIAEFAKLFEVDRDKVDYSYHRAAAHYLSNKPDQKPGSKIAVLGHPYIVKDRYLNFGIFEILKNAGLDTMTPDSIKTDQLARQKIEDSHWVLTKDLLRSIGYCMNEPSVKGVICLIPFNCGPDFLVDTFARRKKPFLLLRIDEHSGDAAFITRIDAFIELVK